MVIRFVAAFIMFLVMMGAALLVNLYALVLPLLITIPCKAMLMRKQSMQK